MASRTQLRLEQLTGSFDVTNGINDQIAASATGSINAGSLQDILSHMAGAIKRVHGGDSFSEASSGVLSGSAYIIDYAGNATADTLVIKEDDGTERIIINDTQLQLLSNAGSKRIELNGSNLNFYESDGSTISFQITSAGASFSNGNDVSPSSTTIGNNGDLGESTKRWNTLYVGTGDFSSDVTIGGNLTVSGDTTTVNTTNLTIQDSIIGLGFTGSNPGTLGDRGILFGRATIGQAIPGLWYDETNSDFNFATSITDPSSGSFGATTAYQNLNAGNVAVYSTTTEVGSLTADVDGNFALSGSAGGDISLESSGLNIFLKAAEVEYGKIKMETDLVLSSSVDTGLTLDANSGKIVFGKAFDTGPNGVGVGAFISSAGAGQESLRIATSDKSAAQASSNYLLDINATNTFANSFMALSGALRLLGDNGASNYVALKSPNSLSATYTLTLPGNDGDANQYLQTDGNGTLTWASVAAAADSLSKAIRIITGSHAAGAEVKIGAAAEITAGDAITGLSIAGSQGKALDVFVNGQLLISGSQSERSAGTRDYNIVADPTNSLEFAFQLEADDVVVVVKRDS